MLSEVFIKKAAREAMARYVMDHDGKNGVAKTDVIRIVMDYGGDKDDVLDVMVECVKVLAPQLL